MGITLLFLDYQHLLFLDENVSTSLLSLDYYILYLFNQYSSYSVIHGFIPAGGVNHYRPSIAKRGVDRES